MCKSNKEIYLKNSLLHYLYPTSTFNCPHCGTENRIISNTTKQHYCSDCGKSYNLFYGTPFFNTKLSFFDVMKIILLRNKGVSVQKIAYELKVSRDTIYRLLDNYNKTKHRVSSFFLAFGVTCKHSVKRIYKKLTVSAKAKIKKTKQMLKDFLTGNITKKKRYSLQERAIIASNRDRAAMRARNNTQKREHEHFMPDVDPSFAADSSACTGSYTEWLIRKTGLPRVC